MCGRGLGVFVGQGVDSWGRGVRIKGCRGGGLKKCGRVEGVWGVEGRGLKGLVVWGCGACGGGQRAQG